MRSRFFCAVIMILVFTSPAFTLTDEEYQRRFEAFFNGINDAANKISWSSEYNLQDVEFVRDEMNGDETIYARAW